MTLQARYKFDETSGLTAYDSVGDVNGVISRNASLLHVGAGNGPGGQLVNAGFNFDADLLDEVAFAGGWGIARPYSIAAWVKTSSTIPSTRAMAIVDNRNAGDAGTLLYTTTSPQTVGAAAFTAASPGVGPNGALGTTPINDGEWHHLMGVVRTTSPFIQLYLDGVSEATNTVVTTPTIGTNPKAGQRSYTGTDIAWDGAIADIRVYYSDQGGNVASIMADGQPSASQPIVVGRSEAGSTVSASAWTDDPGATADWKWYTYPTQSDADNFTNGTLVNSAQSWAIPASAGALHYRASVAYTSAQGVVGPRNWSVRKYVDAAPIARYKMEETGGTTVTAGVGTNGTKVGGNVVGVGVGNGPGGELVDCGITFDGIDDYIDITLTNPANAYTLCAWVKLAEVGATNIILDNRDAAADGAAIYSNTTPRWSGRHEGSLLTNSSEPTAGVWTHVALTYNGSSLLRLLIDGVQVASTAQSTDLTVDGNARIGARADFDVPGLFFKGDIADVRIYDTDQSANIDKILIAAEPIPSIPQVRGDFDRRARIGVQLSATATSNDHTATPDWKWYSYTSEANALSNSSPTQVGDASTFTPTDTHGGLWVTASVAYTNVGGAGRTGVRFHSAPIRVESVPLAHYKLDDDAPSTTVVATKGVNGFVAAGGNTEDLVVAPGTGPGGSLANAGFTFDGVDDVVECPDPKNGADSFMGGNAFSIAFWINSTDERAYATPIGNYLSGGYYWYGLQTRRQDDPKAISVGHGTVTADILRYDSPQDWPVTNRGWKHILVVRVNDVKSQIYIDGELAANNTFEGGTSNNAYVLNTAFNTKFGIGAQWNVGTTAFANFTTCKMADVRIYGTDEGANVQSILDAARPTCSVALSGTVQVGQTLTATITSNDSTAAFEYQWYRSDDIDGLNEVQISGATAATYAAQAADEGKRLRCRGRSTNTGGAGLQSNYEFSDYTVAVAASAGTDALDANGIVTGNITIGVPTLATFAPTSVSISPLVSSSAVTPVFTIQPVDVTVAPLAADGAAITPYVSPAYPGHAYGTPGGDEYGTPGGDAYGPGGYPAIPEVVVAPLAGTAALTAVAASTGSVSPVTVNVAPLSRTAVIQTPIVSVGGVNPVIVAVAPLAATSALTAVTASTGSVSPVSVAVAPLAATSVLTAVTASTGSVSPVTVNVTPLGRTAVIQTPIVSVGGVNPVIVPITPLAANASITAVTASTGSVSPVSVAVAPLAATSAIQTPVPDVGGVAPVSVNVTPLAASSALTAVTASTGSVSPVSVAVAPLAATSALTAVTASTGSVSPVSVAVAPPAATSALTAVTASTGSVSPVTVNVAPLGRTSAIQTPIVSLGGVIPVIVSVQPLPATATVVSPIVPLFPRVVAPLTADAALTAVTATKGSVSPVSVSVTPLTASSALVLPLVETQSQAQVPSIAAYAGVNDPSVLIEVAPIDLAPVVSQSLVRTPLPIVPLLPRDVAPIAASAGVTLSTAGSVQYVPGATRTVIMQPSIRTYNVPPVATIQAT